MKDELTANAGETKQPPREPKFYERLRDFKFDAKSKSKAVRERAWNELDRMIPELLVFEAALSSKQPDDDLIAKVEALPRYRALNGGTKADLGAYLKRTEVLALLSKPKETT